MSGSSVAEQASHRTVDVILVGADPAKAEELADHLAEVVGLLPIDARDCARDASSGSVRITLFADLAEREAEGHVRALTRAGAILEQRAWVHPDPCDVVLLRVGVQKIAVIAVIAGADGKGLASALALYESAPCVVGTNMHRKQAERLRADFEAYGAEAQVRSTAG